MNLDTVKPAAKVAEAIPAEEKVVKTSIDREFQAEIIDKYIMGEPVEKTVMITKIKAILRAPNVAVVNEIYRDVAMAAKENYINMQVESSACMMAAYVREFNGHDFAAELKDEYGTIEGKKKIREHLDKVLIEPVRDALSDAVYKFYEEVKLAFADESLDFS